jgi:bifunctional non-homologous end joining protein LigD
MMDLPAGSIQAWGQDPVEERRGAVPAGDSATIELDGHRLALTHLRKVLYPAAGTTKSDIIGYFAEVAHAMLPHLADRPVTRKRWPDGVTTAPFFHKDLPKGTPTWVTRRVIMHSDGPKAYPLVDSPATLAWLGQIAALELHVPQWTFPASGEVDETGFADVHPNRLVFDLDPGPGVGLAQCAEVARAVRARLDGPVVPVTSGSKGIHLYCRLDGTLTSDDASAFAREVAEAIEQDLPDLVVSRMAKVLRANKVFIDWSQNNGSKTTIAPYSLRGRDRPTVAAPRTWEELADPDLRHLEYTEVLDLLSRAPDPMQGLESGDNDGAEHRSLRPGRNGSPARAPADPSAVGDRTTDEKLDKYRSMRSAGETPEPVPEPGYLPHGNDDTFVIQEHHARRLHYDFRLERGGVLVSWAVPKGIPPDTGHNRLAVQTEDHPLDYADFAGIIPRGEYGGGTVTIWDAGTYVTEKWRDDEVIIVLNGQRARGRYALIRTKDSTWLLHRMKDQGAEVPWAKKYPAARAEQDAAGEPSPPKIPAPPTDLGPMLATAGTVADISDGDQWRFEGKWDGIRAIATVGPKGLTLRSRAGNDFTHAYPELQELLELLAGHSGVLDGEIVALDGQGRTSFSRLQQRMNLAAARDVNRVRQTVPVQFWLFDVLHLDGVSLLRKRYDDRRRILEALPLRGGVCRVPDQLTGPVATALQSSVEAKWEGIVAKKADSTYLPAKRSRSWIKIKNFADLEVVVVGWRPGAGRREGSLGSLLVAVPEDDGTLRYAGKVGTGFSDAVLDHLMQALEPLRRSTSVVPDSVPREDAADARWVEPELVGEVKFGEWTPEGRLRAASWRGLRPDKSPADLMVPPR